MEILIILTVAVFALMLYLILKRSAGVDDDESDEVSDVFLNEGEVRTDLAEEPPMTTEREPRDATSDDDLWSDDSLHLD